MFFIKRRQITNSLTILFCENADRFNGLYNSIDKIIGGESKKTSKALDEFYERISFVEGLEYLSESLKKNFPASGLTPKKVAELGKIISKALQNAGIYHTEKGAVIVLTSENALHYQEWDANELYVDSKVQIVFPAWYQNGTLIEKGYCSLCND